DNNWMEFTGLTADSTTLYVNRGNRDALLTGFQIEAVPEPSSAGLLALAGLLTLARRKRA
ncbi:MprA protease, GlyGly-CTERM protein-sorting domain-containing form, partial [Akkermansiaceae bacterium]|nr:MprA protease, GlyGly-CTERM protein-sorting domain-containing form [Akkermansiaceae bacterium]